MARATSVTDSVSIQGGVQFEVAASGSDMVEILNRANDPNIFIRVTDVHGNELARFGLEKSGGAVVFASQLKHAIESVSKDAQTLAVAHYQERQAEG